MWWPHLLRAPAPRKVPWCPLLPALIRRCYIRHSYFDAPRLLEPGTSRRYDDEGIMYWDIRDFKVQTQEVKGRYSFPQFSISLICDPEFIIVSLIDFPIISDSRSNQKGEDR